MSSENPAPTTRPPLKPPVTEVKAIIDRRALQDKLRTKLHSKQQSRQRHPTKSEKREKRNEQELTRAQSVDDVLKMFNVTDPGIRARLISALRSGAIKNLSELSTAIANYMTENPPPPDVASSVRQTLLEDAKTTEPGTVLE